MDIKKKETNKFQERESHLLSTRRCFALWFHLLQFIPERYCYPTLTSEESETQGGDTAHLSAHHQSQVHVGCEHPLTNTLQGCVCPAEVFHVCRPPALFPPAGFLHVPDLEDQGFVHQKGLSLPSILIFLTLFFHLRPDSLTTQKIEVGSKREGYVLYTNRLTYFPVFLLICGIFLRSKTENLQKSR